MRSMKFLVSKVSLIFFLYCFCTMDDEIRELSLFISFYFRSLFIFFPSFFFLFLSMYYYYEQLLRHLLSLLTCMIHVKIRLHHVCI